MLKLDVLYREDAKRMTDEVLDAMRRMDEKHSSSTADGAYCILLRSQKNWLGNLERDLFELALKRDADGEIVGEHVWIVRSDLSVLLVKEYVEVLLSRASEDCNSLDARSGWK